VVEEAFGDMRGALVAIEPETGDVLAYVSRPGFDPNLFVDGIDAQSWSELNTSLDRPLMNRPLSGTYPPGSTFKPFMALAALELGKRRRSRASTIPASSCWAGTASTTTSRAATATSTCTARS
jgi:penicillin-binding protein 2